MGKPIKEIEEISPKTFLKLIKKFGISTVHDLFDKGLTRTGRKELAEKTGFSETLILEWVKLADLFRIEGIGEIYSDLLEEAGVDTVEELSKRVPENLHAKLKEVNEQKKLAGQLPSFVMVKKWIEEAKKLPRIVEYDELTLKELSEEKIIAGMIKDDFIFHLPPVREYTVRVRVKKIEKAKPHIVEPEVV